MHSSIYKAKGDEKRDGIQETRCNPELCGQIRPILGKYAHAVIGEGVEEVQPANEKKGNSEKSKEREIDDPAGIPGQNKNHSGNDHAHNLAQAVEEEVVVQSAGEKNREEYKENEEIGKGNQSEFFFHGKPRSI